MVYLRPVDKRVTAVERRTGMDCGRKVVDTARYCMTAVEEDNMYSGERKRNRARCMFGSWRDQATEARMFRIRHPWRSKMTERFQDRASDGRT